jgi:hypothetical protein
MDTNTITVYVDPPQGYMYGFPKIWDKNKDPDLKKWLVKQGYPRKTIKKYGDSFLCRIWESKVL